MHDDITVAIPVFTRVAVTDDCLNRVWKMGFKNVIVADDGGITPKKKELYAKYQELIPNFRLLVMEYNAGLSRKRNEMVRHTKTKYFLHIDNDNIIRSIDAAYHILENNPEIGGVSGIIVEDEKPMRIKVPGCNLHRRGKYIVKVSPRDPEYNEEWNYFVFDFVSNCILFRTETLREYPWDDVFKIGWEHIDFYMTHLESKWKFVVCPEVCFQHYPTRKHAKKFNKDDDVKQYLKDRFSSTKIKKSREYFLKKWNLEEELIVRPIFADTKNEFRNRLFQFLYDKSLLKFIKTLQKYI